jgi:hypothetical protein
MLLIMVYEHGLHGNPDAADEKNIFCAAELKISATLKIENSRDTNGSGFPKSLLGCRFDA